MKTAKRKRERGEQLLCTLNTLYKVLYAFAYKVCKTTDNVRIHSKILKCAEEVHLEIKKRLSRRFAQKVLGNLYPIDN